MIQKTNRWAWVFVMCFIVGVAGSLARAQFCPTLPCPRNVNKTKSVAYSPTLGDHYPQDHSQPGSGIGPDPLVVTQENGCQIKRCRGCAGATWQGAFMNGHCGAVCVGSYDACLEASDSKRGHICLTADTNPCNSATP